MSDGGIIGNSGTRISGTTYNSTPGSPGLVSMTNSNVGAFQSIYSGAGMTVGTMTKKQEHLNLKIVKMFQKFQKRR